MGSNGRVAVGQSAQSTSVEGAAGIRMNCTTDLLHKCEAAVGRDMAIQQPMLQMAEEDGMMNE